LVPLAGLEPAACCLGDNCRHSAQTGPVGSRQLRLERHSVQCGLVGCSRAWWNDRENDHQGKQRGQGALRRWPGSNVQFLTRPAEAGPRQAKLKAAGPILVGNNVWLGGGVIVCPGVGIGENIVVGAGVVDQGPTRQCGRCWQPGPASSRRCDRRVIAGRIRGRIRSQEATQIRSPEVIVGGGDGRAE
jgi:hypothetical protein